MILKLVYGKEIHVYDLKAHQSLDHVCQKIRDMFKKLPDQFTLIYKNAQLQQIQLNTTQQFDALIQSLKNDFKTVKLFINPVSSYRPVQTKSEQVIDTKLQSQVYENTQIIDNVRQLEDWTDKFVDLNLNQHYQHTEKHQEVQQSQKKVQQDVKLQKPLRRRRSFLSSELSQEDRRTTEKNLIEFGNLNISPQQFQTQTQKHQQEERQNKSERQLNLNFQESSDPQDLKKIVQGNNEFKKENLNQIVKPSQEIPQIINPLEKVQISQQEQKQLFKPNSQQKIQLQPSISQKLINPQPLKVEQVQDDFRSHNAKCDICNAFPIYGVRYRCVLCKNYDLCQKCEEKYSHQHPLLKICYTYQTPIKIDVEILEFSNRSKKEQQVVLEREDLTGWTAEKLNQRDLNISSQLSELLNIDFQECITFVKQNRHYTKETLTQLLINGKCENKNMIKLKNRHQEKHILGGIIGNIKNFFNAY